MPFLKLIPAYLFAALLLFGAYAHVFSPEAYEAFLLEFIPEVVANILAAISEAAIGIALILPKYRKWGGLGFFLLMIAFLPLHVWDVFRESPAIGSQTAAYIRLLMQLVLIYGGWWIWKKGNPTPHV